MKPRLQCCIAKEDNDNVHYEACRDQIGNVTFTKWTRGKGFEDWTKPNLKDLKKLRDWLTKVIDYVERPTPKKESKP